LAKNPRDLSAEISQRKRSFAEIPRIFFPVRQKAARRETLDFTAAKSGVTVGGRGSIQLEESLEYGRRMLTSNTCMSILLEQPSPFPPCPAVSSAETAESRYLSRARDVPTLRFRGIRGDISRRVIAVFVRSVFSLERGCIEPALSLSFSPV